jgi:3-hydroxy-9,10-secoandrosta-1,3,5(10)-triene-9,17-dione monooxygenase
LPVEVVGAVAAPVLAPDEALTRARELAPRFKDRAPHADKLRRCPDESIRELNESGLMRVLQPRRIG